MFYDNVSTFCLSLEHDSTMMLEHDGTYFGYGDLAFDLPLRRQAIMTKYRTVVLEELRKQQHKRSLGAEVSIAKGQSGSFYIWQLREGVSIVIIDFPIFSKYVFFIATQVTSVVWGPVLCINLSLSRASAT